MPVLIVLLVAAVIVLPIVLLPVSIVQRYRVGTARRPARAWVATLNMVVFAASAAVAVIVAMVTSLWVPGAFTAAIAAVGAGALLGLLGLALSVWEHRDGQTYFTPNRWLVLALTVLVVARLAWGLWRGWQAWSTWGGQEGWLASAGIAGSLAAGALVIGYGFGFWTAVRWRIARRRRMHLRSAY